MAEEPQVKRTVAFFDGQNLSSTQPRMRSGMDGRITIPSNSQKLFARAGDADMKLTIRDLLWLTLVVAIFLTWFRSDKQRVAELQAERAQFETWRTKIQSETAEVLAKNRIAALNPGAYQDWLKKSEEERTTARRALVQQLGIDDENP